MRGTNEGGIALVIVLWAIALLAVIAASFTTTTRTETKLARNLVDNAKAEALADAGVYRAILALLDPGVEERWRTDGWVYPFSFGGGEVRVSIQDEGGKIDLNRAPDELLVGLFVSVGIEKDEASALVDAIADFRDENDLTRLNGAEDDDYRAAGLAYGAKDRPFEAVEELERVIGMTRELYERVAPLVTVYTRQRGVDPTVAPRGVLLALPGVDAATVDAILAARGEPEAGAAQAALGLPRGYLSRSRARVFTVRAEAHSGNGAVFAREAVVRLTGNRDQPFSFHAWRQGERGVRLIDEAV